MVRKQATTQKVLLVEISLFEVFDIVYRNIYRNVAYGNENCIQVIFTIHHFLMLVS